jgi:MraZ protein
LFYGEYQHSLDQKGRIIIPVKFRDELGNKFILTKGLENCLFAYSKEEWGILEAKLKALPLTDKNARAFERFLFTGATECEMDKQGRVLVPQNLRDYAGLEKDIYIVGVSRRVEIWDKTKWEKYLSPENISPEEIAEKMTMLGI